MSIVPTSKLLKQKKVLIILNDLDECLISYNCKNNPGIGNRKSHTAGGAWYAQNTMKVTYNTDFLSEPFAFSSLVALQPNVDLGFPPFAL